MRPGLFTIAPDRPFLGTLAAGLLATAGDDPLALSRITILLPTRRAARSLREAFLRTVAHGAEPGTPLLLPRMRPIGDLDADGLELIDATADDGALDLPPAIPELRRRMLLTRLVLQWGARRGGDALLPGQAATLAGSLARLLDTVATEGANFADLSGLAPPDLAEHWQTVRQFLEILPRHWPAILAGEGALDPAERRNRLLRRQAALWRKVPPRDPVIAAGLTGGIAAMTELIAVVAGLKRGGVILAGLDRFCDAPQWEAIAIDEAHPQHLLAMLLNDLGCAPGDVRDWPAAAAPSSSRHSGRARLISEAMRPAATTEAWRDLAPCTGEILAGLNRYDCAGAQQEALTVALLLRRKLEIPGATAALVTPDRELARRVAAELRRWGIEIDDSAGVPLNRTPPGVFLRLLLDLAASELAPVPMLAALKHPLSAGGLAPAAFRELTRVLEAAIRGPRPAPGFAGLRAAIGSDRRLRRLVDRLQSCLGPLPGLLAAKSAPLALLVSAHLEAAERLAASDTETGAARLWREAAGETAARFCHELIDAVQDFPALPGHHYPALFEALAADAVVRPAYGRHPRLAIWGLVEGRLQQADLVVLGGLNEGTWPAPAAPDPWMSRQMRRLFNIAVPERAIGIAAHDFAQAMAAPEVALTRAARREGVPTVPSRWLLRLDTVLRAIGLDGALAPQAEIEAAALLLDTAPYQPLPRPEPRPPLSARPRRLSVTQVETWLADPYAIYARHILGLKAAPELDADPGRAELGISIHAALAAFVRRFPRALPQDAEAQLLSIGREAFGSVLSRPGAWAFWWPRFRRIVRWLVAEETGHRPTIVESLSECSGQLTLDGPAGPFELTAVADRIDRLVDGGFLLVDYKTGALPKKAKLQAGFAPQLPLEAAILRDGSFGAVTGRPTMLQYWRLGGGNPAGERRSIDDGDCDALIARAISRLRRMIERFDDPDMPYLAMPLREWEPPYSDYRHLERVDRSEAEE
ncbi:MAG TPA: double-strand break repair protein AddB [Stellaceae bacterium]|nr:double-strand break repair protein AddB [Stellaceae bacterium]